MDDHTPRRSRRIRNVLISAGAAVLLVIICIAGLLAASNKPVQGTIAPASTSHVTTHTTGDKVLKTPYYDTRFPEHFEQLPAPSESASLDAQVLSSLDAGRLGVSIRIALTVTDLPTAGVTDDSSYHLFKSHPEIYTLTEQTVTGDTLVVATRSAPNFERTFLWPHGKYLLTIVVIADSPSVVLDEEMQSILRDLQWIRT